jgi:AcrR family transcriptional regulator
VPTTRDRLVATTAELFRRQGYHGTGLKQVITEAGAPFGSLYHFFPGGKQELGGTVIREAGLGYQHLVTAILDAAPDLLNGVGNVFAGAGEVLEATGYEDACPIATVALEVASTNDPLRQATADVFEGWMQAGTERFVAAGLSPRHGRELAQVIVMLLEGAFLLCRAARNTEAMDTAGKTAVAAVKAAMPGRAAAESGERTTT